MIKLMLTATLLVSSFIYADWIDDISQHAHGTKIDIPAAVKIIKGYIRQDTKDIINHSIQLIWPHKKGIVSTIRAGATAIKESIAEKRRDHHKKVLKFLSSLSNNERDREKFAEQLSLIRVTAKELTKLKKQSSKTATLNDVVKNTSEIAAKELYIQGLKARIQGSFLLS